jgi:DNA-binding response OmpR family regulator
MKRKVSVKKESRASQHKKILCVEDDKDNCEILSYILADYDFTFAHSFEEAASLIQTQQFDLYILDNWLPDGSGVELCRKIRAENDGVPIIFISGVGRAQDIQEALNAGAQKYLVKPYEPENLQKIVKELINKN